MVARRFPVLCSLALVAFALAFAAPAEAADVSFTVTLPAGSQQPLTGRVFVIVSRSDTPEPRLQVGS